MAKLECKPWKHVRMVHPKWGTPTDQWVKKCQLGATGVGVVVQAKVELLHARPFAFVEVHDWRPRYDAQGRPAKRDPLPRVLLSEHAADAEAAKALVDAAVERFSRNPAFR